MDDDNVPFWKQDREVLEQRQLHRLKELEDDEAASDNALSRQDTRVLVHMMAKVAFGALVLTLVSYQAVQFKDNFDTRTKASISTPVAVVFEAEDAELKRGVTIEEDSQAIGGKYIEFR